MLFIWKSSRNHKIGGSNMCHYTYFATEERKALKAQEMHIQAIAKELERVSSSVSREF